MTLKSYLWGMRISTVIALGLWLFVALTVNPDDPSILTKLFFYVSLFLFLSGFFILSLTGIRRKISGDGFVYLGMSFRQGILLSLLVIVLLVLQSFRVLLWWDGLLVVAGVFLIELYFLSR